VRIVSGSNVLREASVSYDECEEVVFVRLKSEEKK
jgi:hypothetical protein